jgi:peptide/nickel transport system ATP-binding protein
VLGLVGESGAGKSTIGLAALGYLRPGARGDGRHGAVCLGQDLLALPEEERRPLSRHPVSPMSRKARRPPSIRCTG